MALVVPNICRYTLEGTYQGRPWANVIDAQIDTTGSTLSRQEAIQRYSGVILNAWGDNFQDQLTDTLLFTKLSYTDLNSSDGVQGERTATSEYTLPLAGTNGSNPSPSNVAVLYRKVCDPVRGQRDGRMYVPGVSEGQTSGSVLEGVALGAYDLVGKNFLSALDIGQTIPASYSARMAVVHTTAANPDVGTWSPVRDLVVQSRLATQRRRLRK